MASLQPADRSQYSAPPPPCSTYITSDRPREPKTCRVLLETFRRRRLLNIQARTLSLKRIIQAFGLLPGFTYLELLALKKFLWERIGVSSAQPILPRTQLE
jgi:hypothetical protein